MNKVIKMLFLMSVSLSLMSCGVFLTKISRSDRIEFSGAFAGWSTEQHIINTPQFHLFTPHGLFVDEPYHDFKLMLYKPNDKRGTSVADMVYAPREKGGLLAIETWSSLRVIQRPSGELWGEFNARLMDCKLIAKSTDSAVDTIWSRFDREHMQFIVMYYTTDADRAAYEVGWPDAQKNDTLIEYWNFFAARFKPVLCQ